MTTTSLTYDTTPSEQDLAAAREQWASLVAECHGLGLVDYARYRKAQQVAVELGVVMRELVAPSEFWAQAAGRARALYEEWMRS